MKFTTPVSISKSELDISHQQAVLLVGSCFAVSIGEKLSDHKFNVTLNPNGIIYNPISILTILKRIIEKRAYTNEELLLTNNKWISFNHHGSFSAFDKSECLTKINSSLTKSSDNFKQTKTIFITFGSAWVYEYPDFGIVANCHKIPNKEFNKRLLTVKEILCAFEKIKEALKDINVVFTVSPVRHIKDGLHENNLSKSTLHLAVNNLVKQHSNYHYFPAYELVVDELRDYRFYKNDLVHPTDLAVYYVWDKFGQCYFNQKTIELNEQLQQIKNAINHKPFNYDGEQHQQFIANQIQLIDELVTKHSFLDFKKEKAVLRNN